MQQLQLETKTDGASHAQSHLIFRLFSKTTEQ
jgi:hypothetical protein